MTGLAILHHISRDFVPLHATRRTDVANTLRLRGDRAHGLSTGGLAAVYTSQSTPRNFNDASSESGKTMVVSLPFWAYTLIPPALAVIFWLAFARRARRLAYPSTTAYLRAAPRSDSEKRDAVDLALKGMVCFVLSLMLFGPFLVVSSPAVLTVALTFIPLFYGTRKLAYAWLGLGLIDDGDSPDA